MSTRPGESIVETTVPECSCASEAIWWRLLVEQSRDGIVVIDRQGKVFWANEMFASLLGYTRDETYGLVVWDWDAKIPAEALGQMLDDADQNGHHFETVHRRKDGSFYEVEINTNAVECGDRKLILCICRDITERKRTERNLQQLFAETRALADQLELQKNMLVQSEKLASLGQLAAGVAHEINNPLAYVSSNFDSLKEYLAALSGVLKSSSVVAGLPADAPAAVMREAVDDLRTTISETDAEFAAEDAGQLLVENSEGVERIRTIVNGLKGFIGSGDSGPGTVSVRQMVESVLTLTQNQWRGRCEVELELDDDLANISCLPGQIEQVLVNLVVNACHAIEDAGTIRIVAGAAGDDAVQIAVSDDGVGIPGEQIDRIFDPFFTTREVGKGAGLGLHIAHAIIDRHGGEIRVDSRAGFGSTFTIVLPCRIPVGAPPGADGR